MKTFEMSLAYADKPTQVTLRQRNYANGRPALEIIDATDGLLFAVASVNLPDVLLEEDEILIKDYSENEGMLNFLTENNIITVTENGVESGFVWIPVCKLLPESEWGKSQILNIYEINGNKIHAKSYEEALQLLPLIENA